MKLTKMIGESPQALAKKYGTPLFVYSKQYLIKRCQDLLKAFNPYPTLPCYALKANPHPEILKILFKSGFGADVVSLGELKRALDSGADPKKIVFSGVGKQKEEILFGIRKGVLSFNVESVSELRLISELSSQTKTRTRISLRINPNIDVKTNPYIATGLYKTKFGLPENQIKEAIDLISRAPYLELVGLSCHLGSQILSITPYQQAAKRLLQIAQNLEKAGFNLKLLNLGGGFGVSYKGEKVPTISDYARSIQKVMKGSSYQLVIEPGRWLVAEMGVLISKVLYVKSNPHKNFLIIDASMTELIRPALYEAYHPIELCKPRKGPKKRFDVVGPVCETGDFLGLDRDFGPVKSDDLVLVGLAGAYGASMSSEYNLRPKAKEIVVG